MADQEDSGETTKRKSGVSREDDLRIDMTPEELGRAVMQGRGVKKDKRT